MFIIDRFEGDLVIVEFEGKTYDLPRKILPPEVKEGDVLRIEFTLDTKETLNRKEKIKQLEDELFE